MLKFNIKEHKLEELEKYGFCNYSKWYCTNKFNVSLVNYKFGINDAINDYLTIKDLYLLYDLIKDGLIIKGEEDE